MHELSIALSLVEIAGSAAAQAGVERVSALHVRVGALAGVVRESLEFSFEIAAADTPLAGARLEIEAVPVLLHCAICDADVAPPSLQQFRCPRCGTPSADVVQGRELNLVAIEYDEEPQCHSPASSTSARVC